MNELIQDILQMLTTDFGGPHHQYHLDGQTFYGLSNACAVLGLVAPGAAIDRTNKQGADLELSGTELVTFQGRLCLSEVGVLKLIIGCGTPSALEIKKNICLLMLRHWV